MTWLRREDLLDRLNAATAVQEITWESIGGACPMQGWGRDAQGREVYFRFRSNDGQLYIGHEDAIAKPDLYAEVDDVFSWPDGTPDDLLGVLDGDQLVQVILTLVGSLKPPSEWENGTRRQRLTEYLRALAAAQATNHDGEIGSSS